jgi:hypothetical protein
MDLSVVLSHLREWFDLDDALQWLQRSQGPEAGSRFRIVGKVTVAPRTSP